MEVVCSTNVSTQTNQLTNQLTSHMVIPINFTSFVIFTNIWKIPKALQYNFFLNNSFPGNKSHACRVFTLVISIQILSLSCLVGSGLYTFSSLQYSPRSILTVGKWYGLWSQSCPGGFSLVTSYSKFKLCLPERALKVIVTCISNVLNYINYETEPSLS